MVTVYKFECVRAIVLDLACIAQALLLQNHYEYYPYVVLQSGLAGIAVGTLAYQCG